MLDYRSILIGTMVLASACPAHAASMKSLQGAWVVDQFKCSDTFVKRGGKVAYRNKGSMLNTGIIISGSRIEGPYATCTANKIKPGKNGTMTVLMSCASHIMAGGVATSFRVLDKDHFEHFENAFPEIAVRYQRCEF